MSKLLFAIYADFYAEWLAGASQGHKFMLLRGMSHAHTPAPLSARRTQNLSGRAICPPDKSISHRCFLLGLLANGVTHATNVLESADVLATKEAAIALGASVQQLGAGEWKIRGAGLGLLHTPGKTLDFGNAGTGTRLTMGVVAGHGIQATFDGDASLRKRPMGRALKPLIAMGARVMDSADGLRVPLTLQGTARPIPLVHRMEVASAQVKSAILLAGLNSDGTTRVIEPVATRDHTENMLKAFGADISVVREGHDVIIDLVGGKPLQAQNIKVPGDPSSAAFLVVAALIVPGSDVTITDVMMNPLRAGLFTTLLEMGADIYVQNERVEGGEPVADLRVRHSQLRGIIVPPERAPSMIDEYPILAIAASFAQGETRMCGLEELRVKESDRLAAIAEGLRVNGVAHEIQGDDLIVIGAEKVNGGGLVQTHLDHRIAMSFLIMSLASEQPITVDDTAMIATSFPNFIELMQGLGAEF